MPAPFFIVGPTAVGKSRLATKVAVRCGAEIVGADAFQIYAGLDLLTAKPPQRERSEVPHHMVGVISPATNYNVARYLADAQRCLESISSRGKHAIVVGGTGLYVKALTHGLSPLPEANQAIRAELEPIDPSTLLARLRMLDPLSADTIDPHNKRRLIRAMEVCLLTGQPFSKHQTLWGRSSSDQTLIGVFLGRSKSDLHARIEHRVVNMFNEGVVEEVRAARTTILSPTASRMIGLLEIQAYLAGQLTLDQCREEIKVATRQYAKRQTTWFQREEGFEKIDLSTLPDEDAQVALLSERYTAFVGQT